MDPGLYLEAQTPLPNSEDRIREPKERTALLLTPNFIHSVDGHFGEKPTPEASHTRQKQKSWISADLTLGLKRV